MVQRKLIEKSVTPVPAGATAHMTAAAATAQPLQHLVPYKNGLDCVRRILAEEGIRGMFAGLSVNLVRSFSGAVLLVAYDDLKQRL